MGKLNLIGFNWKIELSKIIDTERMEAYITNKSEEIQGLQSLAMYFEEQVEVLLSISRSRPNKQRQTIEKRLSDANINFKLSYFHTLKFKDSNPEEDISYEIDPTRPFEKQCEELIQNITDLYHETKDSVANYRKIKYDCKFLKLGLKKILNLEKMKQKELNPLITDQEKRNLQNLDYLNTTLRPFKDYSYDFIDQQQLSVCIEKSKESEKKVYLQRKSQTNLRQNETVLVKDETKLDTKIVIQSPLFLIKPHPLIDNTTVDINDCDHSYVKLDDGDNVCKNTSYCASIKTGVIAGIISSTVIASANTIITDSSFWMSVLSTPVFYTFTASAIMCSFLDYKIRNYNQQNKNQLTM